MNKNITLFLVLSFFNFAYSAENTTKMYSLEYVVSPKNCDDLNDFNNKKEALLSLFEDLHRSPDSNLTFFDKLLVFIKELQEAVVAGVNLISSSTAATVEAVTAINQVAQIAEDAVEAVETTVCPEVQTKSTDESEEVTEVANPEVQTKAIDETETTQAAVTEEVPSNTVDAHNIKITTIISCDDQEKEASFEILKNKMSSLAENINAQTCTPEEFVEQLSTIIKESKELELIGNMNINVQG